MASLDQILLSIRAGGLRNSLKVLRYTIWRDWHDWRYTNKRLHASGTRFSRPGSIISVEETVSGCKIDFDAATLKIEYLAENLSRIAWLPGVPIETGAIIKNDWKPVSLEFSTHDKYVELSSSHLQIRVLSDGSLIYTPRSSNNDAGPILRQDEPPVWNRLSITTCARLYANEVLFGLGVQSGPLNLRQRIRRLWAHDPGGNYGPGKDPLYMPIPIYMGVNSAGCYLIFHDNPNPAAWIPDHPLYPSPNAALTFEGGQLIYYVITGSPPQLLERYTELTGRAPLPPRWSLGYHQSRWGYKTEQEIRQLAAGFREHNIPLSAVHLDLDHLDGCRTFTINTSAFPNFEAMVEDLKQSDIHTVAIVDPGINVDQEYEVFRTGKQKNVYLKMPDGKYVIGQLWGGDSVYPDFCNPAVQNWWGDFYERQLHRGIDGIWHDMNEPTAFVSSGNLSLPMAAQHTLNNAVVDHFEAHNLYGFYMNLAGYESLKRLRPDKRPWILSRSGWAGGQRYAWNWTADIESSWAGLRTSLISTLGIGLSGFAYTGTDIGGFSGDPSPELFLRWFQLAAFMPFFRVHSSIGTKLREPWRFGEPYTSAIREIIRWRYRLLPFWYTLAWQHTQNGAPFMRPLFWTEPENEHLWNIEDEFILGESILVAPILSPGIIQRKITLPSGIWHDFWSGTVLSENQSELIVPVTLPRMPVLARTGSIIPIESRQEELQLHVYTKNGQASGVMYSDAGDGYGLQRIDRFQLSFSRGRLELLWEAEGEYTFPYQRIGVVRMGDNSSPQWIDCTSSPINKTLQISV